MRNSKEMSRAQRDLITELGNSMSVENKADFAQTPG